MKNSAALFAFLTIFLLSSGISAQTFTSSLNGQQTIPSNNSAAAGVGSVIINAAETNITVTLYFSGLNGTQTFARIQNQTGIVFNLPNGNFSQNFVVTAPQVAELKAGQWFINVGSATFPNGEIRGQCAALASNNAVTFPFSNGALDPTFDGDGILTTDIGGGNNFAQAVAVQSDGKIVAAGSSRDSVNSDEFAVARYNPDGTLDNTFDGDGIATVNIAATNSDAAFAVIIQPDGKIVLAGQTFNGSLTKIAVVRLNANGSPDPNFDGDGIVVTSIGSGSESVRTVALQTDGKIVVAGQTFNGANNDIAVLRYNSDGSLDNTFDGVSGNGNGIVTTAVGTSTDTAYGVVVQTDGKIVVAGYYFNGANNDVAVLRYDTNGVLDTSFDGDGIVTAAAGTNTDEAFAVALQTDGKIVIAGCTNNSTPNDFLIMRFNTNGNFDSTFGTNGITITPIGNGAEIANSVAIQADGKIVAAGFSSNGSNNDFAVIRQNTDGSLDRSFDGDGKLTTPIGISVDTGNGTAIQADGKIVVVGRTVIGSFADFGVVRYGYGTNTTANDGFFGLNSNVQIRFTNAFRNGATFAGSLNSLSMPPLPNGLNLLTSPRNIQTSAAFSGEVTVKFILPERVDSANFNAAQILHFENGAWIDRTTNTPPRDFATRTIYARVTSLDAFAVVSPLTQTAANVSVSGRILTAQGKAVTRARITFTDTNGQTYFALTNPFGYYRFTAVALRGTYIFNAISKSYKFSPQILTVNDQLDDLNFTSY